MVIAVIAVILFVPLSSAFGSWHWSSSHEACGTEVIKKGEVCDLHSESKQSTIVEKSCSDGFLEIIKKTTNSSQCVKESSFEKLIMRGWGISP